MQAEICCAFAALVGKRRRLYFGQDGCPYCRELRFNSFSQKAIVDKAQPQFMAVALNIWGDREVTWVDGRRISEKDLARHLRVQFTPTLLLEMTASRSDSAAAKPHRR